jgi:hypothetical protein
MVAVFLIGVGVLLVLTVAWGSTMGPDPERANRRNGPPAR